MHVDWWTLGLQAINVVILIWMMSRFLFRPVATMIAARRAHIDGLMQVAEDKRVQAEKLQADLEGLRYGISAERDQALQAARAAGEEAKAAMLAQAEAEAAEIRKRAADERAREQVAFEERLLRRAADLAVDISARLLKRVAGEQPLQPFLAGLVAALRELPNEQRVVMAVDGHPISVVTAAPLSESERRTCRQDLARAFGAEPVLDFTADPQLLAGVELRGRSVVLRNSWRADLDRILEELSDAQRH